MYSSSYPPLILHNTVMSHSKMTAGGHRIGITLGSHLNFSRTANHKRSKGVKDNAVTEEREICIYCSPGAFIIVS